MVDISRQQTWSTHALFRENRTGLGMRLLLARQAPEDAAAPLEAR